MQRKAAILLSGLVAVLMVTCAIPFMASEDSDALTGNSNLSLDKTSAIIFVSGTTAEKKCTFTVDLTNAPAGTTASDVRWKLSAIGDGSTLVSFSSLGNVYTKTGGVSATVYSKTGNTGSIEVVAYINGTTDYYASAVVVVKQSVSTTADEFHFYFKIDSTAYTYVHTNCYNADGNHPVLDLPSGYQDSQFYNGFWITVTQTQTGLSDANFNANSALQWYLNANSWSNDFGYYGWINSLLGLESYQGDPMYDQNNNYIGDYWYYWGQYTLTNSGWTFNNTTLDFITEEGSSYIGLIFWASPPTMDVPTPAPDFPAA